MATSGRQMPPEKKPRLDPPAKNGSGQKDQLPIHAFRKEILQAVRDHRVVVLIGETGSGKTTQVPQFLHKEGFAQEGVIAVTQPRRVAAVSLAVRVAAEMNCEVGGLVGYHVRFLNYTSKETHLKYMTDGMLVRESAGQHGLCNCGVVILDEAHERSIHTDILFGLVKQALDQQSPPNLRVIVMSATIDARPFVDFFGGPKHAKLLAVPGRLHPVDIFYTPTPEPDFLEAAYITVLQIHLSKPLGDILVFLPGQEDIDGLQRILEEKRDILKSKRAAVNSLEDSSCAVLVDQSTEAVYDFVVRPIYAALSFDQQQLVFKELPTGCRKIVLATNIAETSITIPGIRYVVDSGLMKLKACHPQTGVDILRLVETSQASACQRAGRAGREAPGEVYRLYVELEFDKMPKQTPPEILRCDMSSVYLQLKSLGVENVSKFPLLDPPPQEALVKAAHFLCRIGALDKQNTLTDIGRKLAMLPLDPLYSFCLLTAIEFECVAEVLSIVAMLSTETPCFATQKHGELAPATKELLCPEGDHLSLLSIFSRWKKSSQPKTFAREHSLNQAALERALTIRQQLKELMQHSWGMKQITSCGGPKNWVVVRRCLLKACFTQTARLDQVNQNLYSTMLTRQTARLHPTSVLFKRRPPPPCVIYAELVTTSKNYLRTATEVDPAWLVELCPQHFASGST